MASSYSHKMLAQLCGLAAAVHQISAVTIEASGGGEQQSQETTKPTGVSAVLPSDNVDSNSSSLRVGGGGVRACRKRRGGMTQHAAAQIQSTFFGNDSVDSASRSNLSSTSSAASGNAMDESPGTDGIDAVCTSFVQKANDRRARRRHALGADEMAELLNGVNLLLPLEPFEYGDDDDDSDDDSDDAVPFAPGNGQNNNDNNNDNSNHRHHHDHHHVDTSFLQPTNVRIRQCQEAAGMGDFVEAGTSRRIGRRGGLSNQDAAQLQRASDSFQTRKKKRRPHLTPEQVEHLKNTYGHDNNNNGIESNENRSSNSANNSNAASRQHPAGSSSSSSSGSADAGTSSDVSDSRLSKRRAALNPTLGDQVSDAFTTTNNSISKESRLKKRRGGFSMGTLSEENKSKLREIRQKHEECSKL